MRPRMANEEPVEKILQDIGEKLRQLRKECGYTSAESFAYDHDLPRVHYWRIESGKVNITVRSLHRILSIHRLTLDDFFTGNKHK